HRAAQEKCGAAEYCRQLERFQARVTKKYVSELDRSDAMMVFAKGRDEHFNGTPLNQKTINRSRRLGSRGAAGIMVASRQSTWQNHLRRFAH
ncbi:MAG: hypothetical protein ACRD3N_01830, partial [Terracidiphilus sp.]